MSTFNGVDVLADLEATYVTQTAVLPDSYLGAPCVWRDQNFEGGSDDYWCVAIAMLWLSP